MKDFLYGIVFKRLKRWTRAGLIDETEVLLSKIPTGSKILSIGGYGTTDTELSRICKKYDLVLVKTDIDMTHSPEFVADISSDNLPFGKDFAAIVALEVFEHVIDYDNAINNLHSIIVESGIIIISVPWIIPVHDKPGDFRRYTHFELDRIFGSNFDISIASRGGYGQSVLVLGLRGLISGGLIGKIICFLSFIISFFVKKPKIKFSELQNLPDSTIGYFLVGESRSIIAK